MYFVGDNDDYVPSSDYEAIDMEVSTEEMEHVAPTYYHEPH